MNMPPASRPRQSPVLIAVVNYRTDGLVVDCLSSLAGEIETYTQARVVIVDNASSDGSAERIEDAIRNRGWSDWASLVRSERNGGFAYGTNLAIASAPAGFVPSFIWLLNPDTRVRPGALHALIGFMRAHPQAGIAGSLIEDADGIVWPYAFRFPSIASEIERGARLGLVSRLLRHAAVLRRVGERPTRVDWVSGASMMIRAGVLDAIGPLDEDYFLYFEETDFCLRANRVGWQCWYVPDARVLHIAGQSTGLTGKGAVVSRLPRYWFESRRHYFVKNHGRAYAVCADLAWMTVHAAWRLRRKLQSLPDPDPAHLLSDFLACSALRAKARNPRRPKDDPASIPAEMQVT
ncbi:glycosyltransferase family 2 protein [Sphingobium sp. PNB]|uniref:glycosyltransferase family 2 protein n=1 Tax=Sphingobium sp. PNB TaxID=863934 RepID=UPI001D009091|nr:glycosyltransferase family 2 protein [Sphingobium sp. PNB]MCB4858160.1 glycosyltransferase family 2 protein [Sphingobium sp. PNB]